ncbi:MAG: DNA ligase, partial [Candidatus Thermoplasmatota archaeon]|nr:DNA ligase [Candidatus Thermoplasmatota archaeon]
MKFSKVSEKFTEMSQTRKRLELTAILVDLLKDAQDDLKELIYLIQGKLAPDYEGIQLGMADKQLAKGLSAISGKPQSFIDEKFAKEGDLGNVAKEIMSS